MGVSQPYMYSAEQRNNSRFPETTFDPKAVTRASWEPQPKKPKPDGPLVSFNRHPDAHMVLSYRSNNYVSMGARTKTAIKWLRRLQLMFRLLEMNGAIGILVLMILFTKVDVVVHWVLRIAPGVVVALSAYAVYHLARDAAGRTPASSAAYHLFAGFTDLCALGFYAFGAFIAHRDSHGWGTMLTDHELLDTLVPAIYYIFIGTGGLHFISLLASFWLGWAFRKIALMPPDMNPLEDNLTARPLHKRNKSSVATFSTSDSEKRDSITQSSRRYSGLSQGDGLPNRDSVHFMHTRAQSRDSFASRNSYVDLPSRQYQIIPGNSPRHSALSLESKRLSTTRYSQYGSQAELPQADLSPDQHELESSTDNQARVAKFTETWKPTDSLISRTNQRNREIAAAKTGNHARATKAYAALSQRYDVHDSDSEYEDENDLGHAGHSNARYDTETYENMHPNPLRCNPASSSPAKSHRAKTPFRPLTKSLSEINNNERRVSASRDITEESTAGHDSNQQDLSFYSRPYGELKSRTPPVLIGANRKISSGNDFDSKHSSAVYGRRNVSGKLAEEGRSENRFSYYGPGERRY